MKQYCFLFSTAINPEIKKGVSGKMSGNTDFEFKNWLWPDHNHISSEDQSKL